jgi:hypothetical protein
LDFIISNWDLCEVANGITTPSTTWQEFISFGAVAYRQFTLFVILKWANELDNTNQPGAC